MNIFILDIFMYQKPSNLGHSLSYQQVVLFEIKLEEEMLLFYTHICIMTLTPIFTPLCFVLFSCTEGNYFYYLAEQWIKVSPKQERKTEYLLCNYPCKGCELLK